MSQDRSWSTSQLQHDTLQIDDVQGTAAASASLVLTVISHPDLRRCGELVTLHRAISISRLEPLLVRPGGYASGPLADPFLSRKPTLRVEPAGDRARLVREHASAEIRVDGVPLVDACRVTDEQVARGVVIELQNRIAFLLHRRDAPPHRRALHDPHMVGTSDAIDAVRKRIEAVVDTDATVLVLGQTGCGKELVAQALHARGPRANKGLVSVNCGAIEPSVLASTLFGHTRGAFTGADRNRPGLFREADGGTLFLDEIGDAPPEVQRALLRVLETSEIVPVGSDRAEKVDVRLIAATDAKLSPDAGEGPVRSQLLHRLAQFVVEVPPLAQRAEDIALLFHHFVRQQASTLGVEQKLELSAPTSNAWIAASRMHELYAYHWPGNVRELRNVAMRSVIVSAKEQSLALDWGVRAAEPTIPPSRPASSAAPAAPTPEEVATPPSGIPAIKPMRALRDIGEEELLRALEAHDWRPVPAARAMNISKTSMYQLIRANPSIPESTRLGEDEVREALAAANQDVRAAARALRVPERGLRVRMKTLGIAAPDR